MLSKAKVKYIQSLGQKKSRDEAGLFIAEGPKIVKEFLESAYAEVQEVFALKDWLNSNWTPADKSTVNEVTAAELERISQMKTPNQVLAVIKKFESNTSPDIKESITLALDRIQDPGNMGTIIRIADWFGIKNMICSEDCADIYNPKVVQATMGSLSRINIVYSNLHEWLYKQTEIKKYAAALNGSPLPSVGRIKEGILIIGNESNGIEAGILALADEKIVIPGRGNAESLNAAVATGIILSHITG